MPKELKKYEKTMFPQITGNRDMNMLYHIGKRSGAGLYCEECGTTFCRYGTVRIHYNDNPYPLFSEEYKRAQKDYWYEKCPICGKEGTYICTFTWTFMKQKQIIYKLLENPHTINEKLIYNEYAEEFTPYEFIYDELGNCPVEYQSCCEFC